MLFIVIHMPVTHMEWDHERLRENKGERALFHYSVTVDGQDGYKEYQIIIIWRGDSWNQYYSFSFVPRV